MLDYSRRDGFFPPTSGRLQFPCQSSFESFHWLCCWLDLLLQALPLSLGIDFSEMLVVPNKLIAAADYMAYWTDSVNPNVWIVIYAIPPIIFNLFNVRRYGEIEFWLTLQKVITFVLLIAYGLLMAMQASAITPWSGTNSNYEAVPCAATASNISCVASPGFNRTCHERYLVT